jgi:hypothetical protein
MKQLLWVSGRVAAALAALGVWILLIRFAALSVDAHTDLGLVAAVGAFGLAWLQLAAAVVWIIGGVKRRYFTGN